MAKYEQMLQELQARYDELEEEANEMREELARRNNTKTVGTQTKLKGSDIDAQDAEIKRLKVMLEELQMKLKELLEECARQKIGGKVMDIADKLGLKEVIDTKRSVFERLYADAKDRVGRLERLREKVAQERGKLLGTEEQQPEEPSVMSLVEKSDLRNMQSLAPPPPPSKGGPSPKRTLFQEGPEGEPMPPRQSSLLVPSVLDMSSQIHNRPPLPQQPQQQHQKQKQSTSIQADMPPKPQAPQPQAVYAPSLVPSQNRPAIHSIELGILRSPHSNVAAMKAQQQMPRSTSLPSLAKSPTNPRLPLLEQRRSQLLPPGVK
eukprot:TRINITY_DN14300_c0_g2_i1.p1 TRINITY_DN14300_c0_g2~~TRINITY_DN14300_c0_g2_i1.p1  ORF type:complete len:320 (-),score=66.80 TRINITY_DN14300_c0_g2_i1:101-1060(-)